MKLELFNKNLHSEELAKIDLTGVTNMRCSRNQLTSLPTLPLSLGKLDCNCNQLRSLPELKIVFNLKILICDDNRLTSLPILPPNLQTLICDDNQLTSLPILPLNLQKLNCSNNRLTSLPTLPSTLCYLSCRENTIKDEDILKNIPYSLQSLSNDKYYSETRLLEFKLETYNNKRLCLEKPPVTELPTIIMWKHIDRKYINWQYSPGGNIFLEVENNISKLLPHFH